MNLTRALLRTTVLTLVRTIALLTQVRTTALLTQVRTTALLTQVRTTILLTLVRTTLLLTLGMSSLSALAQVANDEVTQRALVAALPEGVTPDQASADQIAQAAIELAFNMEGDLEANVAQVTVALGELTRAGTFKNAPRIGDNNPPGRFYTKVMNLASSNLDVSSSTYYALTVQDMTRLSAAVRRGMNFLNGASSNAITRK